MLMTKIDPQGIAASAEFRDSIASYGKTSTGVRNASVNHGVMTKLKSGAQGHIWESKALRYSAPEGVRS